MSYVHGVEIRQPPSHVACHPHQLVGLFNDSCLSPLPDKEGLEIALGAILQHDDNGWTSHTHTKQGEDVGMLKESVCVCVCVCVHNGLIIVYANGPF